MKTGRRVHRRYVSRQCRSTPYQLPSCNCQVLDKDVHLKKCTKALEKADWEDATCSVCLEYPHNAVLLLCSSHDKGCRPYMCATSYRYSNCLDQYEKAYKKEAPAYQGQPWHGSADYSVAGSDWPAKKCEGLELACPLCRGQVKGWTVVEAARKYLNAKKRTCMQDKCSFAGTYKQLRKHVKQEHPSARPRELDPILEQKWETLEDERARDDAISTIRSSMPGAMVLGDYVIERNHHYSDSDDEEDDEYDESYEMDNVGHNFMNVVLLFEAFGARRTNRMNARLRRERGYHQPSDEVVRRRMSLDTTVFEEGEDASSLSHHRGRVVDSGRQVRRQQRSQQ
ncbi:hypothetical protein IFM89_009826 [Coptis chinensis]|uniref:Uncharacterized protein n=1 Tax=Coptis chinensis TaxID=261450 RepID=A0A835HYG9_9MAGN|nr:hypothetical protein IFM89_009826 [Coptis chinensis]